jgi:hypothetical protein
VARLRGHRPSFSSRWLAGLTVTGFGPFPAFQVAGKVGPVSFSSIGPTHSLVVIAALDNVTGTNYVTDGMDGTHRRLIRDSASGVWGHYSGVDALSAVTATTGLHVFTSVIVSGTSDVLRLDGSNIATGSAGDEAMTGLTWAHSYDGTGGVDAPGRYLFIGVYDGDVRSDGGWASWITEVSSHYGLTV